MFGIEGSILHHWMENSWALIDFGVFLIGLFLYQRSGMANTFYLMCMGLIGCIATLAHSLVSVHPDLNLGTSIPYTYLPERCAEIYYGWKCVQSSTRVHAFKAEDIDKYEAEISWKPLFVWFAVVFSSIAIAINFTVPALGPGRPQEFIQIIPAVMVLMVIWRSQSIFGRFMKWSTLATLFGGMVMLTSYELFDTAFVLAHLFKGMSATIILLAALEMLFGVIGKKKWKPSVLGSNILSLIGNSQRQLQSQASQRAALYGEIEANVVKMRQKQN